MTPEKKWDTNGTYGFCGICIALPSGVLTICGLEAMSHEKRRI
jgi:hypothetical protein